MINNVTLLGRWTKDIDLRFTPQGKAVARGTLAVQRDFKNQAGDYEADFIQVQVWGASAEFLANRSGKGLLTGVTGRIKTDSYDGQDGKKVYTTEVVANSVRIVEWKDGGQSGQNNSGGQNSGQSGQNYQRTENDPFSSNSGPVEVSDDDLPF